MANQEKQTLSFLESLRKRCPDHLPLLESLGDMYTKAGLYPEGLEVDLLLVSRQPDNGTYWYNLGCSHCRLNDFESALSALNKAVENGYSDCDWMLKDDDLSAMREHPGFKQLVETLRKR